MALQKLQGRGSGGPRAPQEHVGVQTHLHNDAKILFALFTPISYECSVEFSRDYVVQSCNRLNADAGTRIQPSSVESDTKEICKDM